MGVRCGGDVGLARYLSKVKNTCASPPSVPKTLEDHQRCSIIWRPGGRKEDPPRGRGEDCPNSTVFPNLWKLWKTQNLKKTKNSLFKIFQKLRILNF
jgi:hypothetical protein